MLPARSRVRPATSYVREMAMSIFTPERLEAGVFADICAGSGLVGFEALSRGAERVIFVEADRQNLNMIRENARRFVVDDRCTFLCTDARRIAPALPKFLGGSLITAAFVDPPFIPGMAQQILEGVARAAASFSPDALIILRSEDELKAPNDGLRIIERRSAGHGVFWLLSPLAGVSSLP